MGLIFLLLLAAAILIAIAALVLIRTLQYPHRLTYASALAQHLPTRPQELKLEGEEHTFVLDDDTRAPGWIIRGRAAEGPTIIVTHGWSDSRYGALTRAPLFVPHASRVIVYDLRGHGEHTAPRSELTAREPDDLLAIARQIDDGSPVVFVGISMGAGIALVAAGAAADPQSANRDPQSSAAAPPFPFAVVIESAYRHMMEPVKGLLRRHRWPTFPIVQLADWHLRFWLGMSAGRAKRANGFDRAMHAGKLACPLLVLHGEADDCSLPTSARAIAAAAPDATLVMFPGNGHVNLAVADEERYAAALAEFFARIRAPSRQGGASAAHD